MDFWNENTLKEALGNARFYNFPENWSSNGMILWQENYCSGNMILVRTEGQTKGVLPHRLAGIIETSSALVANKPQELFKYNKPIVELVDGNGDSLIKMARYIRKHFNGKVVGVTGSSGKSTTTQMLVDIFSSKYKVDSNIESKANTTWGIAWNMTCFDPDGDYWVIETSLGGGMSKNAAITKPDYGIIMNVAPVHLTGGLTLEGIADEKAKIFNGMSEGRPAIIYEGTQFFDKIKKAAEFKNLKIITFGESENADIRVICDGENKFVIDGKTYVLNSEFVGKHILLDMAAALAVVNLEGFDIEEAISILRKFKTLEGRGETFDARLEDGRNITVVDEAYNANPLSMSAAITSFGVKYQDKNKILVIGDMAECGEDSEKYHREIAVSIDKICPKKVLLCGADIKYLYEEIKEKYDVKLYSEIDELKVALYQKMEEGDCILIKASHSGKLYKIVSFLKKYII